MTPIQTAIANIAILDNFDDLKRAQAAVTNASNALQVQLKSEFRVGDEVTFSSKRGQITGTVDRLLQKNIKVKVSNGGFWTVSPSLLEKVS